MNKERKILLTVLYFTLLFSFAAMSCLILSDRKETARVSAELLEKKKQETACRRGRCFGRIHRIHKKSGCRGKGLLCPPERGADPYGLGIRITEMLKEGGAGSESVQDPGAGGPVHSGVFPFMEEALPSLGSGKSCTDRGSTTAFPILW